MKENAKTMYDTTNCLLWIHIFLENILKQIFEHNKVEKGFGVLARAAKPSETRVVH